MDPGIMRMARGYMKEALGFANVEYTQEGIESNIMLWGEAKRDLIRLMSQSPYWDEDTLRMVFSVPADLLSSREERKVRLVDLLDSVYSNVSQRVPNDCPLGNWDKFLELRNMVIAARTDSSDYKTIVEPWVLSRANSMAQGAVEFLGVKDVTASEGMKTSRLFQRVVDSLYKSTVAEVIYNQGSLFMASNIASDYDRWSTELSMLDWETNLTISVNPADYLLMSYGNSWSSCCALNVETAPCSRGHGEYKAAGPSYMVDKSTVIVSLQKAEGYSEHRCEYAGKLARELMFVDIKGKSVFITKVYPNGTVGKDAVMVDTALLMMGQVFAGKERMHSWEDWGKYQLLFNTYLAYDDASNNLVPGCFKCSVSDDDRGFHATDPSVAEFYPSETPYCFSCGGGWVKESAALWCENCDPHQEICERCGYPFSPDELSWLCPDCADEKFPRCDECGDRTPHEDLFDPADHIKYMRKGEQRWCNYCIEHELSEEHRRQQSIAELEKERAKEREREDKLRESGERLSATVREAIEAKLQREAEDHQLRLPEDLSASSSAQRGHILANAEFYSCGI